jgi:hypothetical protein
MASALEMAARKRMYQRQRHGMVANVIIMAKEMKCRNIERQSSLMAKAENRKPKPAAIMALAALSAIENNISISNVNINNAIGSSNQHEIMASKILAYRKWHQRRRNHRGAMAMKAASASWR